VRIASAVGDDGALSALRKEVQSADAAIRDAAIRGLAAWPTPTPLEDLVSLARTAQEPVHRILALRAAVRLSSKAQGRTPEQMTALVTELMQLAREPAERKVLKDILKPVNLALGGTATSPDGLEPDGSSGGDKAAIDGDPNTYWDEVDNAGEYRLRVTFAEPKDVSSINILWHPYEQHQAKNLDILCDGKVVTEVRDAKCFDNEMFVAFAAVRCTSVELVIPGKNGLVSPAIHEFQIFGDFR
jgi:hypothetical protein